MKERRKVREKTGTPGWRRRITWGGGRTGFKSRSGGRKKKDGSWGGGVVGGEITKKTPTMWKANDTCS